MLSGKKTRIQYDYAVKCGCVLTCIYDAQSDTALTDDTDKILTPFRISAHLCDAHTTASAAQEA